MFRIAGFFGILDFALCIWVNLDFEALHQNEYTPLECVDYTHGIHMRILLEQYRQLPLSLFYTVFDINISTTPQIPCQNSSRYRLSTLLAAYATSL